MAMTPRGLRRLDAGARALEAQEQREAVAKLRHALAGAHLELERAIGPLTAPGPHRLTDAEVSAAAEATADAARALEDIAHRLAIRTDAHGR